MEMHKSDASTEKTGEPENAEEEHFGFDDVCQSDTQPQESAVPPVAGNPNPSAPSPQLPPLEKELHEVRHTYEGDHAKQLTAKKGALVRVIAKKDSGWWECDLVKLHSQGIVSVKRGWLPSGYLKPVWNALALVLTRSSATTPFGIAIKPQVSIIRSGRPDSFWLFPHESCFEI